MGAIAMDVHVRWMIRRDYQQVLGIERVSFDHPFDEDDLLRHLRRQDTIGLVAERDGEVVGHCVYRLTKNAVVMIGLAVLPSQRRTGVGERLVARLLAVMTRSKRKVVYAEVPERRLSAQLFFRAMGFRTTSGKGVDVEYENGVVDTVYPMEYRRRKANVPEHERQGV